MYSSDGRLSLQSLSEFESSRSWTTDNMLNTTPPPPVPPREEDASDSYYMGICLPKKLTAIFPTPSRSFSSFVSDGASTRTDLDSSNLDEESSSEGDNDGDHCRVCLICYKSQDNEAASMCETDAKIRK